MLQVSFGLVKTAILSFNSSQKVSVVDVFGELHKTTEVTSYILKLTFIENHYCHFFLAAETFFLS